MQGRGLCRGKGTRKQDRQEPSEKLQTKAHSEKPVV